IDSTSEPTDGIVGSSSAAIDGTADGTVGPLIRNVTLRNNSVNGLWIRPSPDTGEATVPAGAIVKFDDPIVHVLTSLPRVAGSGGPAPTTLTISPGMVVKGINSAIEVDGTAQLIVGSSEAGHPRVVLTSIYDDTAGFPDAGFDTNNDGIAGVDPGAL